MARAEERDLPPQLTELFHRYVRARDGGRAIDLDALLSEAGDDREALAARIRRYEVLEQAAALAGRTGEPHAPAAGEQLGRFDLIRSLGSGGLSEVFLARDPKLGREVAVKVLDRKVALDDEARAWVLREARSLARIEHAGVLRVFEVTEEDGAMLVVSEHLSGPSLAEVIGEMRRLRDGEPARPFADAAQERRRARAEELGRELLPFTARARVLAALADALATCHDNGILHRDVKPGNVVFDARGAPKLIDFGLAHLSDADEDTNLDITERMMGTAAYLAPEQVDQERTGADPRSDQFSLGTVAYELLTLVQPFHRPTRSATFDAISIARQKPPRRVDPTIPADLERVVMHALERAPEDRYPAVAGLAADLRACVEHRRVSVTDPSLVHLLRLWIRRNRTLAVGVVGAAAALASTLFASWYSMAEEDRRSILASVEAIDVGGIASAPDSMRALDSVASARFAADRFDASSLRRWILGDSSPHVDERMDAVSVRIGEILDQLFGEDAVERELTMFQAWASVVDYERRLNPAGSALKRYRELGRVQFPDEDALGLHGELYVWAPVGRSSYTLSLFRTLHHIDLDLVRDEEGLAVLDPRHYRYVAWDRAGERVVFERDFVVEPGWSELLKVEPPAHPAPTEELWDVARTDLRAGRILPKLPPEQQDEKLPVPAFRVLSRVVTRGEYEEFLAGLRREVPPGVSIQPRHLPVVVDYQDAAEYCAAHGARLPTSLELRVLDDLRAGSWRSKDAAGEWVADVAGDANPTLARALKYASFDRLDGHEPFVWSSEFSADSLNPPHFEVVQEEGDKRVLGIGFRLVYTNDRPEAMHAAERFLSK